MVSMAMVTGFTVVTVVVVVRYAGSWRIVWVGEAGYQVCIIYTQLVLSRCHAFNIKTIMILYRRNYIS